MRRVVKPQLGLYQSFRQPRAFERESRTGVEPRWGCRALELGSYKGIRYKVIVRLRRTQPNKEN